MVSSSSKIMPESSQWERRKRSPDLAAMLTIDKSRVRSYRSDSHSDERWGGLRFVYKGKRRL